MGTQAYKSPKQPAPCRGRNDGLSVDPGVNSYTITGLTNGVPTDVFVRSMVGHRNNMSERLRDSSKWVKATGDTTPVAPPNQAPTVASPIADISELAADASRRISLSSVFADVATVVAQLDPVTASATAITVTGVSSGTATITVTARDSDGNSVSDAFDVTVPAAQQQQQQIALPGPVLDLALTAEGDKVVVSWTAPEIGSAPNGYIVHLKPGGGEQGSGKTKRPKAKKTKVTYNKLEAGKTYNVWVRARNEAGKGERVHSTITLSSPRTTAKAKANSAPTVASEIADVRGLRAGDGRQVSLAGVFTDEDGDALKITAESSDTSVATVSGATDQSSLTVSAAQAGTATITVTASDGRGGSVTDAFTVTVEANAAPQPEPESEQEQSQESGSAPYSDLPAIVQEYDQDGSGKIEQDEWALAIADYSAQKLTTPQIQVITRYRG